MTNDLLFPKGFVFGAATSAFQIEGDRAGRGDCIWDDFCSKKGSVLDGSNGDVACDHVHRYIEDVAIMKKMGLDAYRFSIAWCRIFPDESGVPNKDGVAFYNSLIDELIKNGIEPYITLFHWELPVYIQREGGWSNPSVAEKFAKYAEFVGKTYGDRVKKFITFNEPQSFLGYGYRTGAHPPLLKMSDKEYLFAIHNFFRAHGMAVRALRATVPDAQIGITMSTCANYPASDSPEDIAAAKMSNLDIVNDASFVMNIVHWCDPIYFGQYPEKAYDVFGKDLPYMSQADSELISEYLDFHGQNCYSASMIRSDGKGGYEVAKRPLGSPKNSLNWPVTPDAIYSVTKLLYERYKKPIYITENGICCNDWICEDRQVHDSYRVDFYHKYLKNLNKAISEGVDVRGYFAWSLLDNFEWAKGYTARFGLVYVDFDTQQRILKDSAKFYSEVIKSNKRW